MKKNLVFAGVGLLIVTLLCSIYANHYHYVSADGILHESFAVPLGSFSFIFGVFALVLALVLYVVEYVRGRQ